MGRVWPEDAVVRRAPRLVPDSLVDHQAGKVDVDELLQATLAVDEAAAGLGERRDRQQAIRQLQRQPSAIETTNPHEPRIRPPRCTPSTSSCATPSPSHPLPCPHVLSLGPLPRAASAQRVARTQR